MVHGKRFSFFLFSLSLHKFQQSAVVQHPALVAANAPLPQSMSSFGQMQISTLTIL